MQRQMRNVVRDVVAWSGAITVGLGVLALPLPSAGDEAKHGANSACPGFVVLANGRAVLSEVGHDTSTHQGHGHGGQKMGAMSHKSHAHGKHGEQAGGHAPLMGYQHGQAIVAGKDALCVPAGGVDDTAWTAVSRGRRSLRCGVVLAGRTRPQ